MVEMNKTAWVSRGTVQGPVRGKAWQHKQRGKHHKQGGKQSKEVRCDLKNKFNKNQISTFSICVQGSMVSAVLRGVM
jgi:hypothetical protein